MRSFYQYLSFFVIINHHFVCLAWGQANVDSKIETKTLAFVLTLLNYQIICHLQSPIHNFWSASIDLASQKIEFYHYEIITIMINVKFRYRILKIFNNKID